MYACVPMSAQDVRWMWSREKGSTTKLVTVSPGRWARAAALQRLHFMRSCFPSSFTLQAGFQDGSHWKDLNSKLTRVNRLTVALSAELC